MNKYLLLLERLDLPIVSLFIELCYVIYGKRGAGIRVLLSGFLLSPMIGTMIGFVCLDDLKLSRSLTLAIVSVSSAFGPFVILTLSGAVLKAWFYFVTKTPDALKKDDKREKTE